MEGVCAERYDLSLPTAVPTVALWDTGAPMSNMVRDLGPAAGKGIPLKKKKTRPPSAGSNPRFWGV